MSDSNQYWSFRVGRLYFGVAVQDVQEVIRYQEMTRVPHAPADIAGLINLRGQIVTAIDLRKKLGLPDRSADALPMNVVVRTDDGAVSLLVDEIGDVLQLEEAIYEPAPETLTGVSRELITGVYKLKKELLLILDISKAVYAAA
jgi:purine-binding chemotaxis protein CheW